MSSSARKVIDNIVQFIEVKTEQIKLRIIAKVARLLSGILALAVIALLTFFFLFFLSIALAEILNESLQNPYYGYLILAGVYFVVIILVFVLVQTGKLQKWIEILIVKIEETKNEH